MKGFAVSFDKPIHIVNLYILEATADQNIAEASVGRKIPKPTLFLVNWKKNSTK
jgi:hypothetical protein